MHIDAYLANIPGHRRERFQDIVRLIKSLYPQAQASMKYRMPTYDNGQGWVAVANQKRYISVYTCSAEHISDFKARHPGIQTGKGCINIKDKDVLALQDLEPVIRNARESGHG